MIYYKATIHVTEQYSFRIRPERLKPKRLSRLQRDRIKASVTYFDQRSPRPEIYEPWGRSTFAEQVVRDLEMNYLLPSDKETLASALKLPGASIEFEQFALTGHEKIGDCMQRYSFDYQHFIPLFYRWDRLALKTWPAFSACVNVLRLRQDAEYRRCWEDMNHSIEKLSR